MDTRKWKLPSSLSFQIKWTHAKKYVAKRNYALCTVDKDEDKEKEIMQFSEI